MNVALVFPPSLCLPNQLYLALPLLAGALSRAGHRAHCIDLNVAAANRLLEPDTVEHLMGRVRDVVAAGAPLRSRQEDDVVRRNLDAAHQLLKRGPRWRSELQSDAFHDPATFKEGFWGVVDVLAAAYQLDPLMSPFDDDFVTRIQQNQRDDPFGAMQELWKGGLLDEVLEVEPDLVGICVAFPEQSGEAVRLARYLRQARPEVKIVFGGPMITRLPEKWLENDWLLDHADYVVIGEGEAAIVQLCETLEDGSRDFENVTNLTWRDEQGRRRVSLKQGGLQDMDELPIPDFTSAKLDRYLQPEPIYPLMTSRGCYWGKCVFCSIGYQENYRAASKETLRRDLLAIAERGGRYVQVQDSSIPPKSARMLAEVILEEGLDIQWAGWMKFENCFTDPEYTDLLGRGGCRSLQMGFESSDQRLLDFMHKGYRHEDVLTMLRNLRDAEISADLLWFIGFPSQTKRDVLDTALFLWEHRDLFGLTSFVGSFGLHPDCEVYRDPSRFGVRIQTVVDGLCHYEVESGLTMQETAELKAMLASNNNRTLTCNGSHLIHLADHGVDLSGLERPMQLPERAIAYCEA